MNKIILTFDSTRERISGNSFGQRVFNEQVKENIKFPLVDTNVITLVFPQNIKYIGSSFVQGFVFEITKNIKKERFYQYFQIEGNENLKKQFREGLYS